MKNYHSDFCSQPKFTRFYGLNDFPEAHFLIETKCFNTSGDTRHEAKSSVKGILFVLGIIFTLGILGVFQLYHSLETFNYTQKLPTQKNQLVNKP